MFLFALLLKLSEFFSDAFLFRRAAGFAPCKGEIPRVQIEDLCEGCISLSNAEGLREYYKGSEAQLRKIAG